VILAFGEKPGNSKNYLFRPRKPEKGSHRMVAAFLLPGYEHDERSSLG